MHMIDVVFSWSTWNLLPNDRDVNLLRWDGLIVLVEVGISLSVPDIHRSLSLLRGGNQLMRTSSNKGMASMAEVGLRIILTQIISKTNQSNHILMKSTLISTQTSKSSSPLPPPSSLTSNTTCCCICDADCFLKSCHLCRKKLSPHKDIYMYRWVSYSCNSGPQSSCFTFVPIVRFQMHKEHIHAGVIKAFAAWYAGTGRSWLTKWQKWRWWRELRLLLPPTGKFCCDAHDRVDQMTKVHQFPKNLSCPLVWQIITNSYPLLIPFSGHAL